MDVDAARDIAERVLAECVPTVAATLRGPAAPEDVERLSATVGRELPAGFVTGLRRHEPPRAELIWGCLLSSGQGGAGPLFLAWDRGPAWSFAGVCRVAGRVCRGRVVGLICAGLVAA